MLYKIFKEIEKIIPSSKGTFASRPEKLAELRQIEQVADHNRIAINIIDHVGVGDPLLRASFEFTHHHQFCGRSCKEIIASYHGRVKTIQLCFD